MQSSNYSLGGSNRVGHRSVKSKKCFTTLVIHRLCPAEYQDEALRDKRCDNPFAHLAHYFQLLPLTNCCILTYANCGMSAIYDACIVSSATNTTNLYSGDYFDQWSWYTLSEWNDTYMFHKCHKPRTFTCQISAELFRLQSAWLWLVGGSQRRRTARLSADWSIQRRRSLIGDYWGETWSRHHHHHQAWCWWTLVVRRTVDNLVYDTFIPSPSVLQRLGREGEDGILPLKEGEGRKRQNNNNNNNNKRICIAQVCRMTSEALCGQLQSCYTVRARPKMSDGREMF